MNGEFEALWRKAWADLHDPAVLWQIGAIAAFERAIAVTVWGAFVLYVLGVLPRVVEAFESISIPMGRARVSV